MSVELIPSFYGAYCPSSSLRFRGAPTADYCRIYVNGLVVDLRLVCRGAGLPWGWFVPWLVCGGFAVTASLCKGWLTKNRFLRKIYINRRQIQVEIRRKPVSYDFFLKNL